jgi:hypothetical protein
MGSEDSYRSVRLGAAEALAAGVTLPRHRRAFIARVSTD